jgi:hypothetical protein
MRAALAALCAAAALAGAAPAGADPSRVCGKSGGYVVHEHQLTCSFALKWTRQFLAHKTIPKGFTCSVLTGPNSNIPFFCKDREKKFKTYWVTQ